MTKKQMLELLAQLNNLLAPVQLSVTAQRGHWEPYDDLDAWEVGRDAEEALNRMKQAIYEAQQSLQPPPAEPVEADEDWLPPENPAPCGVCHGEGAVDMGLNDIFMVVCDACHGEGTVEATA